VRLFLSEDSKQMSENNRTFRLVVNKPPRNIHMSGVYLVTDQGDKLIERVEVALRGGVSVLQYRTKQKEHQLCLTEGAELKQLCSRYETTFIVNDNVQLALELDADGVHLGQDDESIASARDRLAPGKIIGKSTHNLEEALQAEAEGADYIGFGAMYPTESKSVTRITGTSELSEVRSRIRIPIVAIGGINANNACRVIDAGADALAIISSILSAPRPDIAAMELRLLFNRIRPYPRGAVMTVAGSDSGGGAGIQADIKTITLLGSYAASALTALTAQNTRCVKAIHGLPASFVIEQIRTVLADIPIDVVKTGMLHTPAIISAIAEHFSELENIMPLVIDPVMISTSGAALMERDACNLFIKQLLPMAYLLTPNIPETEKLLGRMVQSENEMEQAARDLHAMGAANVLVKGGHLSGRRSTDILFNGREIHHFPTERIFTTSTHGTGCSYASAISSYLAQGEPLKSAVEKAKEFITDAIRLARPLGKGHNPINHYSAAKIS
jgi:hydroxymethylpyrimidine kinase / phosphomethylpyrimidine kinase / thiamine-phosphate diphosphorylase